MNYRKQYEEMTKLVDETFGNGWNGYSFCDGSVDQENCGVKDDNSEEFWFAMICSFEDAVAQRLLEVGLDPAKFFKEIGFPRHGDRIFTIFETMAFTYAVSPAQIFTEGSFVKEVPANRKIRFLEEEQYYSILAYMKGYNFYVPRVTGIMHYYSEAYGQVLFENRNHPIQDFPETYVAAKYVEDKVGGLNIFTALKKLKGTARSFSDYEAFAGIDYENRRLIAPVNKIVHNTITEALNFSTEIYSYSINDYIDWMYDEEYKWYQDVQRNENPI